MSVIYKVVKCKIYVIHVLRETKTRWVVGNIPGYSTGYINKTTRNCFSQLESALALLEKNLTKDIVKFNKALEELKICKDAAIDGRSDVLVKCRRMVRAVTVEERRRRYGNAL